MHLSELTKEKLIDFNSYILIAIAFFIPLSVALPNLLSFLIIINWLLVFSFQESWQKLKNNTFVLAILTFILLHFIALSWSSDIVHGLKYTIEKESRLLLIPIFMLFVQKKHIKYYIYAFLLAMSFAELSSYSIYFGIIEPFKYATLQDPTPFLGHVNYNPFLAIAIYLLLLNTLVCDDFSKKEKFFSTLFIFTMSFNMFITGGRAGQVMFFAMLSIFIFQYFKATLFKSTLLILILLPTLFTTIYLTSDLFHKRVNLAYKEATHFQDKRANNDATIGSVGLRLNFALNSFESIKEYPLLGRGTGSFQKEYDIINSKNTKNIASTVNPHNMYIFELFELGLLGFIALLSIFFFALKQALHSEDKLIKNLGVALPLLYMVIMLSESYLLIPNTTHLFALLSAFLYKNYNNE